MIVDPSDLSAEKSYRLLTGLVVPRPIAWVSSLNDAGSVNLAPFSTFTFVSPKPPMLGFSVGRKGDTYKDTSRNILARETYVVHIADRSLLDPLHSSAEEVTADISEAEMLGLETVPSDLIDVPRIAAAPVAMECRLRQVLEFGETRSRFIVGEILRIHLRDGLMVDGKIDTLELDPICRLGGPNYATLGEVTTLRTLTQTPKQTGG
ncbi:flavin reductase family protein [Pseudooceanicola sp. 216_PA32_1]|uniref:Flavin reductase family protein n=1 Tax=Pseudooceanicola pacificus TaxID=2676438 RepID=A0A844WDA8_9RHOB|nr:flavin reductase family protein [Pseudooceanicola pacificus]MWB79138.1 flavin reductase family protein [Pseudooceanicola pacificus]